jgi:hypothetical protein
MKDDWNWPFCDMATVADKGRFQAGSGHAYAAPAMPVYEFTPQITATLGRVDLK